MTFPADCKFAGIWLFPAMRTLNSDDSTTEGESGRGIGRRSVKTHLRNFRTLKTMILKPLACAGDCLRRCGEFSDTEHHFSPSQ